MLGPHHDSKQRPATNLGIVVTLGVGGGDSAAAAPSSMKLDIRGTENFSPSYLSLGLRSSLSLERTQRCLIQEPPATVCTSQSWSLVLCLRCLVTLSPHPNQRCRPPTHLTPGKLAG